MNDTPMLVLAIFGAIMVWTTSVIGGIIWLNTKFRSIETIVYRELEKYRNRYDTHLYANDTRLQRVELRLFGFTGGNGASSSDDGETFPEK